MKRYFFLMIFLLLYGMTKPGFSQTSINAKPGEMDSLKNALANASPAKSIDIIIQIVYRLENIDEKFRYADKIIALSELHSDSANLARGHHLKGLLIQEKGDLHESIRILEHSLMIARRIHDTTRIKYVLNSVGNAEISVALYEKALRHNLENLKLRELDGDLAPIAVTMNNIGVIYEELGDYKKALEYYEQTYRLRRESKESFNLSNAPTNIAGILLKLGRVSDAEEMIKETFRICDSLECRPRELEELYRTYGDILFKVEKYSAAEDAFLKALDMARTSSTVGKGPVPEPIANNWYRLAAVTAKLGKPKHALIYLDSSQQIAEKSSLKKLHLLNYLLYANIYASIGDYKKAFAFQELHNKLNTEITGGDLLNKISVMQTEIEERENVARLASQAKIIDLQQEANGRQKLLNVLTGAVAFLLLCMTIVLIRTNRQRKQVNELLDQRVVERTVELEKQRDELRQAHNEQSALLKKLATDLFSSAASLKGLSTIAKSDLPEEQAAYFRETEMMAEKLASYAREYPKQEK